MIKISDNCYKTSSLHEIEWARENNINTSYITAEQYAEFEIWWAEECEKNRIKEKKEQKQIWIITAIVLVVIVLLIWVLLAAIASASGVGIGSVLFALFFFPAILMAAKG